MHAQSYAASRRVCIEVCVCPYLVSDASRYFLREHAPLDVAVGILRQPLTVQLQEQHALLLHTQSQSIVCATDIVPLRVSAVRVIAIVCANGTCRATDSVTIECVCVCVSQPLCVRLHCAIGSVSIERVCKSHSMDVTDEGGWVCGSVRQRETCRGEGAVALRLARRVEAVIVRVGVRVDQLEGLLARLRPACAHTAVVRR